MASSSRSVLAVSAAALFVTLVLSGGCSSQTEPGPGSATGGTPNPSASGSASALGTGSTSNTGGSIVGGGGGPGTGGGDFANSGSGSSGSGGASSSGGAPPCVDVEPPPTAEWPNATCENWANETESCSEGWFSKYCDASCKRCVPEGGGNTGTGGAPPCVDVEPPPSAEWPEATCDSWVNEADACNESWFSKYCDVSCKRCVPEGGAGTGGSTAVDCSGEGLPNVTGGEGYATRYWDCCQPHCAQFDGHRCGQDGVSSTGDNNSSCNGGGSYACYDEAPHAISDCLSYGYIAKASPNCGGCYRIQFTGQGHYNDNDPGSKLIKGKQMVVKVSNTGSDVAGNQFDLMIPGGGVGQFNACSKQWGTSDLGAQYGGFLTNCTGTHAAKKECVRQKCMNLPAGGARDGCLWFVDWFQAADNPKFTSQATSCPF